MRRRNASTPNKIAHIHCGKPQFRAIVGSGALELQLRQPRIEAAARDQRRLLFA